MLVAPFTKRMSEGYLEARGEVSSVIDSHRGAHTRRLFARRTLAVRGLFRLDTQGTVETGTGGTVTGISHAREKFETTVSRIEAGPADHDLNWVAK